MSDQQSRSDAGRQDSDRVRGPNSAEGGASGRDVPSAEVAPAGGAAPDRNATPASVAPAAGPAKAAPPEAGAQATNFRFPEGFLWGAATSAHQVEGHNTLNDWWDWEQAGKVPERSGVAAD